MPEVRGWALGVAFSPADIGSDLHSSFQPEQSNSAPASGQTDQSTRRVAFAGMQGGCLINREQLD